MLPPDLLPEPLAAQLRELAATRGISVDEVGRQALAARLAALDVPTATAAIVDLGPINPVPPTSEQVMRMPWPIIARGPVSPRTLEPIEALLREAADNAR